MTNKSIFARVTPQKIKLSELYKYEADISANPYTRHEGTPSGCIEMVIPYDGEKYFTIQAFRDIEHQMTNAWDQNHLEARIGYIGYINHAKTDLEKLLDLNFHHNVIPLDIPVRGEGLNDSDSLWDDCHACKFTQSYKPDWPDTTPLQIRVNIFDEDIISELQVGEVLDNLQDNRVKQMVDSIAQQVGFKRSLIFSFDLILALPGIIGSSNDGEPPILTQMAIEWPVATSHRLVHLMIEESEGDKNVPITYDPTKGVIEWGDIPFLSPLEKSQGTNLYTYRTPSMMMIVEQPGELYQQEFLKGEIKIEIPRLFSGLQVACFGSEGSKSQIHTISKTTISTDLTISLEDCFERKTFSPYQHLQFEGVILNEMRVNDIKTLLEDQGFESNSRQLNSSDQGTERFIVFGAKTVEMETLSLWMLIEGTRSKTTRQKKIPGGQTFTTDVVTGHMTIYMRGELQGNSANLTHVMNKIQKHLKERFRHVSTID